MGVRGRPGLLFVAILIIFLAVFFLTWKSMITPKAKTEVKDIYSMNFQSSKQNNRFNEHPHSDIDVWQHARQRHGDKIEKQQDVGHEADEDYDLRNSAKLNHRGFPSDNSKAIESPLSNLLHATPQPSKKDEKTEPYYMKPDESLKIIGGRMERLVHLDLKGAAPKVSYFKEIFPLFSRLGATGLLMEYEDMFPYSGKLQVISAENAYTRQQIDEILGLAKLNSLQVIPLIQTFGHMEFILKSLQMESLRESNFTPQVINVASEASYALIQEMVSQILDAHPAVSYLHVGCDEVYELGKGKSADIIIKEKLTTEDLFLKHVKRVADIVGKTSQKKVRPIIWDDELRKIPDEDILAAGLPSSVDIMVWRYTQNITDKLNETVWKKYGRLFKTVWAASSFKGATGSRQMYTEPQHHIINHFSWMTTISKYGRYVSFKGIALTGWQRFDHFATLCELLPVAIPSLAVCLATIKNGGFDPAVHKTTSSLLGCSGLIEMGFPKLNEKDRHAIVTQDCRFPGHMVYYAVQELWGYKQFNEQGRRTGWMSDYQLKRGFSNPGQLNVLSMRLFSLQSSLTQVRVPLEENLSQIFTDDTVQEWLDENIFEEEREIKGVQEKIKFMMKKNHWARRPSLPLVTEAPVATKAPVKMPSGVEPQNVGNSLKRNAVLGAQMTGRDKIQSSILNDKADVASLERRLAKQKETILSDGRNVADLTQRLAQRPNSPVQTNSGNRVAFQDMTRNGLGTRDSFDDNKQSVLGKSSPLNDSKNKLLDTLNSGLPLDGRIQSQQQNQGLTDNHGQVDNMKRMRLNKQMLDSDQSKEKAVGQGNGVFARQNGFHSQNNGEKVNPLKSLTAEVKLQNNLVEKGMGLYENELVRKPVPTAPKKVGGMAQPFMNGDASMRRQEDNRGAMEKTDNKNMVPGFQDHLGVDMDNSNNFHRHRINDVDQDFELGVVGG